MMFFDVADAVDPWFVNIASRSNSVEAEAYDYVQDLWLRTRPFLDKDLPHRAARQFQQVFWEMYLANALLSRHLPLRDRAHRRFASKGPDLQIGSVDAWIEAIAVTGGTGPDAVPPPEYGTVRSVPDDPIKLRLLSAIHEKKRKHDDYCQKDVVKVTEPYVIGVNAALVPSARQEHDVPRVVRVVFPLGFPSITMDISTGHITDQRYDYAGEVVKSSGATISTDLFESAEFSGISAVLYGCVDPCNRPRNAATGVIVVHNPEATLQITRGVLPCDREYWKEDRELRWVDHAPRDA